MLPAMQFATIKTCAMPEALDIRFSFFCRSTHLNGDGQSPIVFRVSYRGQRKDIFTGLYCASGSWDALDGRVSKSDKASATINKNLEFIQRKAHEAFEKMKFSGIPFSIDELSCKIKGKEAAPSLLIDYLEGCNQKIRQRVGIDITRATFIKYRKCLQHVQDFLHKEYKAKNFSLHAINQNFLEKYFYYLRSDKSISLNTSIKYIKALKTLLHPAIKTGIIKNDPFAEIKFKPKPVHRGYLSQEEIAKISSAQLNSNDLARVRDIFLFACYTGLSYSDLKQLRSHHIIRDNDFSWHIRKPRQKTGQESIIPLLPAAIRILQKYSTTSDLRDFDWQVSSNQKMNKRLKAIGEKACITKMLHMHLARHTFATTITLSNGIPIESVSCMLGHATLRQTQHYAKIVAQKVKNDMAKIRPLYE